MYFVLRLYGPTDGYEYTVKQFDLKTVKKHTHETQIVEPLNLCLKFEGC